MWSQRKLLVAKARQRLPDLPFGRWLYQCIHQCKSLVLLEEAQFRAGAAYCFYPVVDAGLAFACIPEQMWSDTSTAFMPAETGGVSDLAGVHAIQGGTLYTDCLSEVLVFDHRQQIISELSYFLSNRSGGSEVRCENTHLMPYVGQAELISGQSFSLLVGGGGGNFFHWMIDALPRLHLLLKSNLLESVDQFFVSDFSKSFQRDSLALFGITEERIRLSSETNHFQSNVLLIPDQVRSGQRIAPWIFDFFEHEFLPRIAKSFDDDAVDALPRRIYISRRDAAKRNVANESGVIDMLHRYGVVPVELTERSLAEQVQLFRHAELVISPHGASLTNLIFCQKRTKVVELFHSNYVAPMYCEISQHKQLIYNYLICDGSGSAGPESARINRSQAADIYVKLEDLEQLIQAFDTDVRTTQCPCRI